MTTPDAAKRPRVFVVDDEAPIRAALAKFLEKRGYDVISAAQGREALQLLHDGTDATLMLLDVRLPDMSGLDVVPEALDIDPDLAIVMLSGVSDATTAAICLQRGAYDYLTKPIELSDLDLAIERALRRRHTLIQSRELSQWLKHEVAERTRELAQERVKLQQLSVATLEALVAALEAKDTYLSGHSARVAALAATIATHLGLGDDEVDQIRLGGRLHDLGKIGIRESVLGKQGPLTPEEFEHVKEHVTIGSQILRPMVHLGPVVDYVRGHHEHFDGSGYPDALAGDAIPLGARVICAAEIFDALTSARPYQQPLTPEDATDRMRSLAGRIVDPTVMDALATAVKRRQTLVFLDEELPRAT